MTLSRIELSSIKAVQERSVEVGCNTKVEFKQIKISCNEEGLDEDVAVQPNVKFSSATKLRIPV